MFRQARLTDFSADQIAVLTYGRGMDTGRFVQAVGFVPRFSSRAALEEFADAAGPGLVSATRLDSMLSGLRALLKQQESSRG